MSDGDVPTVSLFQERPIAGHVLLIQDGSSTLHSLPRDGVLLIGRVPEAQLRLSDPACSRRHAEVVVEGGDVTLRDLGSHNGTRVNGTRVEGMCRVVAGDVVSIGEVVLVIHAEAASQRRCIVDASTFRQRLEDELDRAARYERELVLVALAFEPALAGQVEVALTGALRRLDNAQMVGDGALVLLPELDLDVGRDIVRVILDAVGKPIRAGVAACPNDGCRADTLIAAARAAASAAKDGQICEPSDAVIRLELAGRRALIADTATAHLYQLLKRLAASDLPVLIVGETGSGKENAAHAVHAWSPRASRPFVAFNCAALTESLAESELFGHEKGAFTGATSTKIGLLEAADGGTVFLDEVGELPPAIQAKLLRALEAKRVMRVGSTKELAVDIRFVAATHRDLETDVRDGRFRQDLFFRLGGAKVTLPPLRSRPRELVLLAREFLDAARTTARSTAMTFSAAAMDTLSRYPWPGNVRELKNEMEYVAAIAEGDVVQPWHLSERLVGVGGDSSEAAPASGTRRVADELRDLERRRMAEAIETSGGVQKKAAELIGMPLRTFRMKSKQYGLDRRGS